MTTTTTTWMGMALLWLLVCTQLVHVHGQTSFTAPSNDDDATTYTGFHSTTPMPFARSDMKANLIDVAYPDYATKGPRIFLVGGCVANQACNLQVRVLVLDHVQAHPMGLTFYLPPWPPHGAFSHGV